MSSFQNLNDNILWYQYSNANSGSKVFADGRDGWRAHANHSVLFVKQFTSDLSPEDPAPGEAELEEYAASGFHEIENQGAYVSIQPGDSVTYTVKWFGREIPEAVTIEKGSEGLLRLARKTVAPHTEDPVSAGIHYSDGAPVTVFPNPVSNRVYIRGHFSSASFALFTISGQECLRRTVTGLTEIDMSHLPGGIYSYVLTTQEEIMCGKFIKLK